MPADDELESRIRISAVDETGDVMRGMANRIDDLTRTFKGLTSAAAVEEFANPPTLRI